MDHLALREAELLKRDAKLEEKAGAALKHADRVVAEVGEKTASLLERGKGEREQEQ